VNLAVIPARGGIKRIPRKNIRPFCGKPMIGWSIEAARESGCFDRIVVSTDDEEIADVARGFGAEVPFVRPAALSDDHTPTIPVIRHAIEQCEAGGRKPDYVCCLYATAPFLTGEVLREGLQLLTSHPGTEFAFSATSYRFPIFRALRLNEGGMAEMFWPEHELTRSQDLCAAYHDAGQFYWGTREAFLTRDGIFSAASRLVVLPSQQVQDIDTEEDWDLAERLFALSRGRNKET
jgi:N-acylneuraminate cytidylyltransferase